MIRELIESRVGEEYELYARTINPQFMRVLKTIGFDRCYVRAEGPYLWDVQGTRYLDMLSGYGVFGLGRNHPDVRRVLTEFLALEYPSLVKMEAPLLCGLLAVFLLSAATAASADERKLMAVDAVAVPATSPIVLDGKLTEEIWQQSPSIVEFVQREPAEGQPATQRTEAHIAYDANALYVAVRAFDSDPSKITGILTRRDQRSPSDWIRIIVDSYFDQRSAYEFGVNPVGVKLAGDDLPPEEGSPRFGIPLKEVGDLVGLDLIVLVQGMVFDRIP